MMLIRKSKTVCSMVVVACVAYHSALAFSSSQEPSRTESEPQADRFDSKRFRKKGMSRQEYARPAVISAQHQLENLHKAIKSEMDLTAEQAKRVDEVIHRFHMELETGQGMPGTFETKETAVRQRPERPVTITNAQDVLRFRKAALRRGIAPLAPTGITPFTSRSVIADALEQLFDGTQINEFNKVATRWGLLEPMVGIYDGPLMRLRRSVHDPKLGLDASTLEDFQNMIGKRMVEFGRDRFDESKTTPIADELRSKILERLTPRQQEHLIATNKALDEDAKVVQEKIAKEEAEIKARKDQVEQQLRKASKDSAEK